MKASRIRKPLPQASTGSPEPARPPPPSGPAPGAARSGRSGRRPRRTTSWTPRTTDRDRARHSGRSLRSPRAARPPSAGHRPSGLPLRARRSGCPSGGSRSRPDPATPPGARGKTAGRARSPARAPRAVLRVQRLRRAELVRCVVELERRVKRAQERQAAHIPHEDHASRVQSPPRLLRGRGRSTPSRGSTARPS
jgi:hypothetical protein